jgi:TRAP-type transport system periplasmic protein
MNRHRSFPVATVAMAMTLALTAAACSTAGADKAGGSDPKVVMLTLADVETDASGVQPFADAVKALSGGALQIQIKLNWRTGDAQNEGGLITDVEQGKADLGVVPVRAFDTVGIDSFRALQAPFLIDSYALEKSVLSSDIPAQMLEGMGPEGLVGLAVLPGDLRKPLGLGRALVAAPDYRGARVGIRPGKVAEATMHALGATPVAYVPGAVSSLDGMEVHLGTIQGNNYDRNATELTANVDFWPKVSAVFASAKTLGALNSQQRAWLREAGPRSLSASWPSFTQGGDTAMRDILCQRGLTVVSATTAQVATLRQEVQPVYDELEQNQETRSFIDEIMTMRSKMGDMPDAVRPCAGPLELPSPVATVTQLDGTWEVTFTREELLAAGAGPDEDDPENYGHFTVTFDKGHFEIVGSAGGTSSGTYSVDRQTLIMTATAGCCTGDTFSIHWSVYRDTLTSRATFRPG